MARLGIVERLYCEMHITVEPKRLTVGPGSEQMFRDLHADEAWRFSSFSEDDVDGIQGKWFLTARADTQAEAMAQLLDKVEGLSNGHFTVLRAKIEDTVFDTKHGDLLRASVMTREGAAACSFLGLRSWR